MSSEMKYPANLCDYVIRLYHIALAQGNVGPKHGKRGRSFRKKLARYYQFAAYGTRHK